MNLKYLFKEAKYYSQLGKGHLKRMLTKFILAKTPLSKMVNTSMYNKLYSKIVRGKLKKTKPHILQIENTNICNARCIMCPHTFMKRGQRVMSLEEFKKICQNVLPYENIKTMVITGFGEPLADPGVIEKIKWLNEYYPSIKIDIYSNAGLLSKELTKELLGLRLHKINFSINGTKKSYKKIMGLNYEITSKNIRYFLNIKKEKNLKFPLVNVSLMILKENKKEVEEVLDFWRSKANSVMAYLPSDWAGQLKISAGINNPFKFKRWPCGALWKNITVDVDGNVIMCCRDYESIVKFGNLIKENIMKIRNSKKFRNIQIKHQKYNFSNQICKTCDNCFDSSLEWW